MIYNWKKSEAGLAFLTEHPILREIIGKTDMNIGFLVAVILAILVAIVLKKTTKGYELRAVGFNRDAAEFAGINVKMNIVHAMLISGAIAAGTTTVAPLSSMYLVS